MLRRYLNPGVLVLVNLLWAAQYPGYKIAAEYMSPAALNFWSLLATTVILLPFGRSRIAGSRRPPPVFDGRAVRVTRTSLYPFPPVLCCIPRVMF